MPNCKGCGRKLESAKVSPGPPGSGRRVLGGWYSFKEDPGPYCPACAHAKVIEGVR